MDLSISVNVCDFYVILRCNEQIKLVFVERVCLLILFSYNWNIFYYFQIFVQQYIVQQYIEDRIRPVWHWKKCKIK